jgi:hypothetical protein
MSSRMEDVRGRKINELLSITWDTKPKLLQRILTVPINLESAKLVMHSKRAF